MTDNTLAISAIMGLSTVELIKLWQSAAPSLEEMRTADQSDIYYNQRILDANYLGLGVAALIGGTSAILVRSWLPILMAMGSVAFVSWWHRQVLLSAQTIREGN